MDMITFGRCLSYSTSPNKPYLSRYTPSQLNEHLDASDTTHQDWWLSPELYLRRPCELHENYRLDRVLRRKAEAGVKVYIIVYKEVGVT